MKKYKSLTLTVAVAIISMATIYIHSETNKTTISTYPTTKSSLKSLQGKNIVKIKVPVANNNIPAWIFITPAAQAELNKTIAKNKNTTFEIVITSYG